MQINYTRLPAHMQDGTRLYIEQGIEPGHFLLAVLSNELVEAYNRADGINTAAMRDWASWLYNECPRAAWGSRQAVEAWMEHNGFKGKQAT